MACPGNAVAVANTSCVCKDGYTGKVSFIYSDVDRATCPVNVRTLRALYWVALMFSLASIGYAVWCLLKASRSKRRREVTFAVKAILANTLIKLCYLVTCLHEGLTTFVVGSHIGATLSFVAFVASFFVAAAAVMWSTTMVYIHPTEQALDSRAIRMLRWRLVTVVVIGGGCCVLYGIYPNSAYISMGMRGVTTGYIVLCFVLQLTPIKKIFNQAIEVLVHRRDTQGIKDIKSLKAGYQRFVIVCVVFYGLTLPFYIFAFWKQWVRLMDPYLIISALAVVSLAALCYMKTAMKKPKVSSRRRAGHEHLGEEMLEMRVVGEPDSNAARGLLSNASNNSSKSSTNDPPHVSGLSVSKHVITHTEQSTTMSRGMTPPLDLEYRGESVSRFHPIAHPVRSVTEKPLQSASYASYAQ